MAKKNEVLNVRKLLKAIQRKKNAHASGMERGLKRAGLWLLRASMMLVPIDTSALKNSGPNVTRSEGTGFDTVMIVGYGTDYAVYVHENVFARHAKGKQAKFLEQPAREGRKTMAQIIITEMLK